MVYDSEQGHSVESGEGWGCVFDDIHLKKPTREEAEMVGLADLYRPINSITMHYYDSMML